MHLPLLQHFVRHDAPAVDAGQSAPPAVHGARSRDARRSASACSTALQRTSDACAALRGALGARRRADLRALTVFASVFLFLGFGYFDPSAPSSPACTSTQGYEAHRLLIVGRGRATFTISFRRTSAATLTRAATATVRATTTIRSGARSSVLRFRVSRRHALSVRSQRRRVPLRPASSGASSCMSCAR